MAVVVACPVLVEWALWLFGCWLSWGLGDVVLDDLTRNIPQGTSAIATGNLGWDLLALGEQGTPPIAMDPFTLETKGIVGWSNKLSPGLHELACYGEGAFGPPAKWDPTTGELWSCTYRDVRRSDERRAGKECVRPSRSRWSPH